ncbi:MAG: hypothetical protein JWN44_3267 [Myxococcales bacterium]|nr:hypothetical protein [Myxococcales bacterium]
MTTSAAPDLLQRNAAARIRFVADPEPGVVMMACPVRDRGLLLNRLSLPHKEKLQRLYRRFFSDEAARLDELAAHERSFLRDVGYLVTPAEEPEPVRFACIADDPARVALDPSFRLHTGGDTAFSGPWVEAGHPTGYVADPRLGYEIPLWIADEDAPLYARLRGERARLPVAPPPAALDAEALHACFARRGFVIVRDILPPALVAAARRYLGELTRNGYLHYEPKDLHYTLFDEALGVELHRLLTPLVQRLADEPIKPSYSYVTHYVAGAALLPHTDNERCQISLAIALDHQPARSRQDAWPLCLVDPASGQEVRALLGAGDALLFRGQRMTHYREGRLGPGETMISLLLHYVAASFEGPLGPGDV